MIIKNREEGKNNYISLITRFPDQMPSILGHPIPSLSLNMDSVAWPA